MQGLFVCFIEVIFCEGLNICNINVDVGEVGQVVCIDVFFQVCNCKYLEKVMCGFLFIDGISVVDWCMFVC